MDIKTQSFGSLVEGMTATIQGTCSTALNFTTGSVIRALVEASASVALWLQYLILQVVSMTRLSTSAGADVDSWVADFGLTRLPATYATGSVTFSSFNPSAQASTVSAGTIVRSGDTSMNFIVTGGPYVRELGVASLAVPVTALTAGPIGNVLANVITIMGTAVSGLDTVTNGQSFTGGRLAETDAALRARFVNFINTRSLATEQAIEYAVQSVSQNLTCMVMEGQTTAGAIFPGHVNVIVDDGTGTPSAGILALVADAVDAVRPVGISVSVSPPLRLNANIDIVISAHHGYDTSRLPLSIQNNIIDYISSLGIGEVLRISRLYGLCYAASQYVDNVVSIFVNESSQDLGGQLGSVVRCATPSVSVVAS